MCNMYTNNDHILLVMLFVSDIVDYMIDGVTHIVTESKWDDNFDEVCFLQCFVDCYCTVTHTWSGIHCTCKFYNDGDVLYMYIKLVSL